MNDTDIVRACAEKVFCLEGPFCDCEWSPLDIGDGICRDCERRVMPNPLTDPCASDALLDKLSEFEGGILIRIENELALGLTGGWICTLWDGDGEVFEYKDSDRKRAIAIAALRAVGAYQQ